MYMNLTFMSIIFYANNYCNKRVTLGETSDLSDFDLEADLRKHKTLGFFIILFSFLL